MNATLEKPLEAIPTEVVTPTHPGEMLDLEFLTPLGLSRYRLAKETGLSEGHIGELISGKRNITAATALRLGAYFCNSAQFWLNLQMRYDIATESMRLASELAGITPNPEVLKNVQEFEREYPR